MRRRGVLTALALAGAARAQAASGWPARPIRLIVGFPAGGPMDFAGRVLQDPLQQVWGQPVTVENRVGASQITAGDWVARQPPDGHTLLVSGNTLTINPAVYPTLPYNTEKDFTPIIVAFSSPTVLFTGRDEPYRSLAEVVAAARRNPGLAVATSGNATSGHFSTELFMQAAGIELTHLPYPGAAPALQDVAGGRVPFTFSTLSGAMPLLVEGRLRPLAIAGGRRAPAFPDVPTMAEAGFPIRDTSPWNGLLAPAGLPVAIRDRIASDVQAVLQRPDFVRRIIEQGGIVEGEGPREFAARITREIALFGELARRANIGL